MARIRLGGPRLLCRGVRSNRGAILSKGALYGGGGIGDRWRKRKDGHHRGRDDHEAKRSFFFRVERVGLLVWTGGLRLALIFLLELGHHDDNEQYVDQYPYA